MSAHLSLTLPVNFWQSVELSAAVMTTPAKAHNILISILERCWRLRAIAQGASG